MTLFRENSPLPVGKLPDRGFPKKISALTHLYRLEQVGLLSSKLEEAENGRHERVFYATDLGRRAYR